MKFKGFLHSFTERLGLVFLFLAFLPEILLRVKAKQPKNHPHKTRAGTRLGTSWV